jgi:hypothetical protein
MVAGALSTPVRRVVAGGVAVALVGSTSWAATELLVDDEPVVDCSVLEAPTYDEAFALAASCNADVLVLEALTAFDTMWATARATFRHESSVGAVRAPLDPSQPSGSTRAAPEAYADVWREVDPSIVESSSGSGYEVAAGLTDVSLAAAPEAGEPVVTMGSGEEWTAFTVPFDLGEVTVDGAEASWPVLDVDGEPLDGAEVVARVRADGAAVAPVVRLTQANALSAVSSVAGRQGLAVGIETAGSLDVAGSEIVVASADDAPTVTLTTGQFLAEDSEDLVVDGASPSPAPEDTTAPPVPEDLGAPAVEPTDGGAVVVADDEALLDGLEGADGAAAVEFGVLAEAAGSASGSRNEWTAIKSGWPTSASSFKFTSTEGVGHCDVNDPYGVNCKRDSTQRLAWEFNNLEALGNMDPADVVSASFRIFGTHSYSCDSRAVQVYNVPAISSATTWANYEPKWSDIGGIVDTQRTTHKTSCSSTTWVGFDVTSAAKRQASVNLNHITIGVKSSNETSMAGWHRYRYDGKFTYEYNRAPNTPTSPVLVADGADQVCASGADRPVIKDLTPTLSAKVSDPDPGNVRMRVGLYRYADDVRIWYPLPTEGQSDGERHYKPVSDGLLVNGGIYRWRAWALDAQGRLSVGNTMCQFAVDISKPSAPTIEAMTSGHSSIVAVYPKDKWSGGVGLTGCFRITPRNVDATKVSYSFDGATATTKPLEADGSFRVCSSPADSGEHTLQAWALDAANNKSVAAGHNYLVSVPAEDAIFSMDEGTGGVAENSGPADIPPLKLAGSTTVANRWSTGPLSLFHARPDGSPDSALSFNGDNDLAATEGPVLDTRKSFAVSTFVRLDDASSSGVAVSQDGVRSSGFTLGYRTACSGGAGCWDFAMYGKDVDAPVVTRASSSRGVVTGEWVHLIGEYDRPEAAMRLWVCPVGTPTKPASGEPDEPVQVAFTSGWQAGGGFVLGRGFSAGAPRDWWQGAVDNVRVFSGEIVATSKIRRMCQGAEAVDFDDQAGQAALDPTVAETAPVGGEG